MPDTISQALTARIAERLADSVGEHRFRMWFDRSAHLAYEDDQRTLKVTAPNRLVADWIDRNFRPQLEAAARAAVSHEVTITLSIDAGAFADGEGDVPADIEAHAEPAPFQRAHAAAEPEPRRAMRHDLEEFIVGPCNQLAFNAALQLVDSEQAASNPLFLHGGVGLGKTHLLQGLCNRFRKLHPNARVLYTTGEKFTNEFLASMGARTLPAFRKRMRRLDLLAIDDVHFLAGKAKSQQEFLHSFDEIDLGGARVAMASDNHPKLIKEFSAALVSRCVRGLVVEVKPPDTATRVKIVRALAQRRGITMLESVVATLANRCQGSVREIEGMLTKLHAMATLKDHGGAELADAPIAIGHAVTNRVLSADAAQPMKRVPFARILDVVSEQLQVSRSEILGPQRVKPIVLARSLVIFLARKLTTMSYPEISTAMQRPSHSMVIAADRRIAEQLSSNTILRQGETLEEIPLCDLIDRLRAAILK